jgi:hypothetical protein
VPLIRIENAGEASGGSYALANALR